MRVALLTSANGWRGSGASYAKIARGLSDRGHVAHLVTAVPKLTDRLREEGLEVTQIRGRDTGPREVWALRRALRALGAQAILADTPRDVRLSFYATLVHRARILYRYNLNYRRPRSHLMDRVYVGRVAACVYQSRFIQDDAVAHAGYMARIPSYQVPNGYDTTRYAPRPEAARAFRERYGISPTARVVLSAAKLTRNKGHDVAIAALNRVRHNGLDLVYVVCGDGQLEGELGLDRAALRPAVRLHRPPRHTRHDRGLQRRGSGRASVAAGDLPQRGRRGHGLRASSDRGGRRGHARAARTRRRHGPARAPGRRRRAGGGGRRGARQERPAPGNRRGGPPADRGAVSDRPHDRRATSTRSARSSASVDEVRWFASNRYTALVVDELRGRGLAVATEGERPARVCFAMSGLAAEAAWRHARACGARLVVYLWDLPPQGTARGRPDPVWWLAGRFVRLPRPWGGYGRRRGYYSRLRYIARQAEAVWVPSALTRETVAERFGVAAERVPYCYDSRRFFPARAPGRDRRCCSRSPASGLIRIRRRCCTRPPRWADRYRCVSSGAAMTRPHWKRSPSASACAAQWRPRPTMRPSTGPTRRPRSAVCPSRFEGFGLDAGRGGGVGGVGRRLGHPAAPRIRRGRGSPRTARRRCRFGRRHRRRPGRGARRSRPRARAHDPCRCLAVSGLAGAIPEVD